MDINVDIFRNELIKILNTAKEQDKEYIDIKSGDFHRQIGGYPAKNHKMPTCCDVMRSIMKPKDETLYQPPKGKGASLEIRYFLK